MAPYHNVDKENANHFGPSTFPKRPAGLTRWRGDFLRTRFRRCFPARVHYIGRNDTSATSKGEACLPNQKNTHAVDSSPVA